MDIINQYFKTEISDAESRHMSNVFGSLTNAFITCIAGCAAAAHNVPLFSSGFAAIGSIAGGCMLFMSRNFKNRQIGLSLTALSAGVMIMPYVMALKQYELLFPAIAGTSVAMISGMMAGLFGKDPVRRTLFGLLMSVSFSSLFFILFARSAWVSMLMAGVSWLSLSVHTANMCHSIRLGQKRDPILDAAEFFRTTVKLFVDISRILIEMQDDDNKKKKRRG